jgi:hypothetical protein
MGKGIESEGAGAIAHVHFVGRFSAYSHSEDKVEDIIEK